MQILDPYWNIHEEIIHPKCGCVLSSGIDDPHCLKRSYIINDLLNGMMVKIFICNEYLRLKLKSYVDSNGGFNPNNSDFLIVLEYIIRQHVNFYKSTVLRRSYDFMNKELSYELCRRPFILAHIPLKEAVIECSKQHYNVALQEMVVAALKEYLEDDMTYKKYKTKYTEAHKLVKKIGRTCGDEKAIVIHELFTLLLTLKSK